MEVKNLEQVLSRRISENKKIKKVCFTKTPVQGVGSVMFKVEVTMEEETGHEEVLCLVAKTITQNEISQKIFDFQVIFKKEVAFYQVIVPILEEFQKKYLITDPVQFARFQGARNNLSGKDDIVDEDAVLLLEDLTVRGFTSSVGKEGFSLNMAKSILRDLAKFHGTAIALKIVDPYLFENEIKPHCIPFSFQAHPSIDVPLTFLKHLIESFEDCAELSARATNFRDKPTPTTCREPFGCVSHFDLWFNNIMNKIEEDGTVKNIFVDFQLYGYRSPAADIFFFLWTSIGKKILEENLDYLLQYYHKNLLNTLKSFNVDTSKFDYEFFQEEMRFEADFEFGHALIFNIFVKHPVALDDYGKDVLKIENELKEFIHFMVKECNKRGWL